MIRYRLRCQRGHEFEAWFRSGEAFDDQAGRGLLTCATCGNGEIEKALMAPSVPASTRKGKSKRQPAEPAPVAQTFGTQLPPELVEIARKIRTHVRENSDYVGNRFAEEARRIHYEESEPRGIYGEATLDEAKQLHEEGIEVHPLPKLPEDSN